MITRHALAKENLPSINDQPIGGDDGDGDPSPTKRRGHETARGSIDRRKRDDAISAWVQKQQAVRGAQTARPSIRDYYDSAPPKGTPKWPPRAVYPPASAR